MKLQILQENLSKALTNAARFTSVRAQLPVLGNIKLSTQKTKLLVASTNLEVAVVISVGAKIESEGDITVPAKTITELVANLPVGTISLEVDKEQLKIESTNFSSGLSGMNASDFPAIPEKVDIKNSLVLPKELLLGALSQVIFAASVDETRPILTGILFIFKKDKLVLVATDGFRLSQKAIPVKIEGEVETLVLPKFAISEISRLAGEDEEILLNYKKTDNQAVFGFSDTILSSRVLQGDYPDYERIIPKSSAVKIAVDKEEMLRAVKLASVFARDSANIVKIKVGKDTLGFSAESSTSGSQKNKIDAKVEWKGSVVEDFEIAFNYHFIEEFLHAVSGEEVSIEFSSESTPGVFGDPTDPTFLHLIMPVKIQS
ncbi:MAG: DNA polymerase III subunit beta [Candidatus Microgenomates bacterium]|jgi:DNA polymerase-3 subunit beta